MDGCNESCSSGSDWSAILGGKNIHAGHFTQTVLNQIIFIPALLIGVINFYHFIPLSVTFALPGGSAESKSYWLHFLVHLSSDQDKI